MKRNFLMLLTLGALTSAALAAGIEDAVNDLIPKIADPKAENRSGPQIELQTLAAKAGRPGAEAERLELAKVLCAKAGDATVPQPARVWIIRQLEHLGEAESVPALARLLADPDAELHELARRALEKNPAPAASVSLQASLRKGGEPRWVIGLVSALGQRHDAISVPLILLALGNPDTSLAAVTALGKIASDAAVQGLWGALEKGTPGAADGLILATDGAQTLYLIEPAPSGFKPLASAKVLSEGGSGSENDPLASRVGGRNQNWAPLALADGKLLLRDQTQLKCVQVAQ